MENSADPRAKRRSGSHEAIHETIRDRICLLIYPPGSLLSENELAGEFGVSRTPVRRALQRLEFEGLVISKHGIGTMVTSVDLREIKEVYALRYRLYDLMGDFSSASRISEAEIAHLEGIREQLVELGGCHSQPETQGELARLYMEFNQIITRTINNDALRQISEQLFYQTSRIWLQMLPDTNWQEEVQVFQEELDAVIAALRDRDIHRVCRMRQEHMAKLLNRIASYVGGS